MLHVLRILLALALQAALLHQPCGHRRCLLDRVIGANHLDPLEKSVLPAPPPANIANVTAETWAAQFQTMFINQLTIVNTFLPGMRNRGWGRILVVSSSGIVQPIPNLGISNAIRASQVGWAKTLSSEVAAEGVTINTIAPGRIHTDRVNQIDAATAAKQGKPVEDIAKASHATIPMGRYGTVAEFADTAVYLLSDNASYITGSIIRVDGGMIRSV